MSERDAILQQALALSPDDRAYVASVLEDSLDGNAEASATEIHSADEEVVSSPEKFLAELQRRSAAYRSGATTSRTADDVLADMRERQAGEAS